MKNYKMLMPNIGKKFPTIYIEKGVFFLEHSFCYFMDENVYNFFLTIA